MFATALTLRPIRGSSGDIVDTVVEFGLLGITFTTLGALVLRQRPRGPVGWVLSSQGLSGAVTSLAAALSETSDAAARASWVLWFPAYGLLPAVLFLVPDELLLPGRWRSRLLATLGVANAATVAALAIGAGAMSARELVTAGSDDLLVRTSTAVALAMATLCGLLLLIGFAAVLRRAGRAGRAGTTLRCLLVGTVVFVAGVALEAFGMPGGSLVVVLAIPVALVWAALGDRLYDLDLIIDRAAATLLAWLVLITAYTGLVWLGAALLRHARPDPSAVVGGVVVGLAAIPAARSACRAVDRLLYGDRGDPVAVVQRVGAHTVAARPMASVDQVLRAIAETICHGLALPYVELCLDGAEPIVVGRPATGRTEFDLRHQGRRLGVLAVGMRTRRARLTPQERALLQVVADQAAVISASLLAARDLAASRERIVAARETERLQLRRDLHDGLGPALAGLALQLRAVRRMADAGERTRLLSAAEQDLSLCTGEVRSIVDRLRPPELDGGLLEAITCQAERLGRAGVEVRVEHSPQLPAPTSAVEVVAYRVVAEALHNAVRHGHARRCLVRLVDQGALMVEIADDGVGLAAADRAPDSTGIGLMSMRERIAEVGGELSIQEARPHGTRVCAVLPWDGA